MDASGTLREVVWSCPVDDGEAGWQARISDRWITDQIERERCLSPVDKAVAVERGDCQGDAVIPVVHSGDGRKATGLSSASAATAAAFIAGE